MTERLAQSFKLVLLHTLELVEEWVLKCYLKHVFLRDAEIGDFTSQILVHECLC